MIIRVITKIDYTDTSILWCKIYQYSKIKKANSKNTYYHISLCINMDTYITNHIIVIWLAAQPGFCVCNIHSHATKVNKPLIKTVGSTNLYFLQI